MRSGACWCQGLPVPGPVQSVPPDEARTLGDQVSRTAGGRPGAGPRRGPATALPVADGRVLPHPRVLRREGAASWALHAQRPQRHDRGPPAGPDLSAGGPCEDTRAARGRAPGDGGRPGLREPVVTAGQRGPPVRRRAALRGAPLDPPREHRADAPAPPPGHGPAPEPDLASLKPTLVAGSLRCIMLPDVPSSIRRVEHDRWRPLQRSVTTTRSSV